MATTESKPKIINRGYGDEKLCLECDEYFPLTEDFFYYVAPSKDLRYFKSICIPCYNYRQSKYKAKAKLNKEQTHDR